MESLYSYHDGLIYKTSNEGVASALSASDSYVFASSNSRIKVFEELQQINLRIIENKLTAEINLNNEITKHYQTLNL